MRRLLSLDWDAIAGVVAAVVAIVMHFLHLIDEGVLLMITVVLLALLFLRGLRRERVSERMERSLEQTETAVTDIQRALKPPDAILIGPRQLLACSQRFAGRAQGDMVWFHVCLLMFKPQFLFDALLRPAVENPMVRSIQFVLDRSQEPLWESEVLPKLRACRGHEKVRRPGWWKWNGGIASVPNPQLSPIVGNVGYQSTKGQERQKISTKGHEGPRRDTKKNQKKNEFLRHQAAA